MLRTKATNERLRNELSYQRQDVLEVFDNKCQLCGFDYKPLLHIHHLLPLAKGGSNNLNNLTVLCPNCHSYVHYYIKNYKRADPNDFAVSNLRAFDFSRFIKMVKITAEQMIIQNENQKRIINHKVNRLEKERKKIKTQMDENNEKLRKIENRNGDKK